MVASIIEGFEHKYNFDAEDAETMHAIVSSILGAEGRDAPASNEFNLPSAVPFDPVIEFDVFSAVPFNMVNQRIFASALTSTSSLFGNANLENSFAHDPVHEANNLQAFPDALDSRPVGFVYEVSSSPSSEAAEQHNVTSSRTPSGTSTEALTSFDRTWYAATKNAKTFKAMRKTKDGRWTPVGTRTPSPYRVSKASDKKSPRARRSGSPSPSPSYSPSPSPSLSPSHRATRFAEVVEFDLTSSEQAIPSIEGAFDDKLVCENEGGRQASSVSSASSVSGSSETTLVDDEFNVDPAVVGAGVGSPRGILKSVSPRACFRLARAAGKKTAGCASGIFTSDLGKRSASVEAEGEGAGYAGRASTAGGFPRRRMRHFSV